MTIFRQPVSDDFESIAVTGGFCDWDPKENRMRCNLQDGIHELVSKRAPGRHEHPLVINASLAPDDYAQESKAILELPSHSIVDVEPARTTSPSN